MVANIFNSLKKNISTDLISALKNSIYPSLLIILRLLSSILLIFVISKNGKLQYNEFSVDFSFISIFLIFGNFYYQKSVRISGDYINTFWLLPMFIVTGTIFYFQNKLLYLIPILMNIGAQMLLSIDYVENNTKFQLKSLLNLTIQILILLISVQFYFGYDLLICGYLAVPFLTSISSVKMSQIRFTVRDLKEDLHMIFWMLTQATCFPIAIYFFKIYLDKQDISLLEYDLLQKFLQIPSLLFGTILSTRIYIQNRSIETFKLNFKPFKLFLFITLIYFAVGILTFLVFSYKKWIILNTISISVILLFIIVELLKFIYGHLANVFYFFGSSLFLIILEIFVTIIWLVSIIYSFEVSDLLINLIVTYLIAIVVVDIFRKRITI